MIGLFRKHGTLPVPLALSILAHLALAFLGSWLPALHERLIALLALVF